VKDMNATVHYSRCIGRRISEAALIALSTFFICGIFSFYHIYAILFAYQWLLVELSNNAS
jgi:hypothetical protein